ncbi:hypothetical protein ABFX02_13G026600 [Erythranthe guttata]
MSNYVPTDLLIEILVKLPVKSLIRFAAVSKSWRSIITSAAFMASHLSKGKNHTHTLIHTEGKNSLVKFTADGPFAVDSPSKLEFPYYKPHSIYLRIVDSCDGLVCLSNKSFMIFPQSRGVIWNPSVRNHVVLPDPTINPKDAYISVLGFGVDAGRTHHKVVRFLYCRNAAGIYTTRVEIFSLKTWSWRMLIGGVDLTLGAYPSLLRQVFLNGVVHWLIEEKPIGDNSFRRSYILAFDVGDEVFGEVMLPEWEAGGSGFAKLSIFLINESLGVVKSTGESCDVWVMKEYCVRESWTKLYTIRLFEKIENVVAFLNSGEALLALENSRLVVYDSETKHTKDLGIYGTPSSLYMYNYVESLLLLRGRTY